MNNISLTELQINVLKGFKLLGYEWITCSPTEDVRIHLTNYKPTKEWSFWKTEPNTSLPLLYFSYSIVGFIYDMVSFNDEEPLSISNIITNNNNKE